MIYVLEWKKLRRTGIFPALLLAGVLAAAFPAGYVRLRPLPAGAGVDGVLAATWQLLAMLNVLAMTACACAIFHVERENGGMEKMRTLPVPEPAIFLGKAGVLTAGLALVLSLEALSVWLCAARSPGAGHTGWTAAIRFAEAFLRTLPTAAAALLLASVCQSLWTALGSCVVCVLLGAMVPGGNALLSWFPFALPFRALNGPALQNLPAAAEAAGLLGLGAVIPILRRRF